MKIRYRVAGDDEVILWLARANGIPLDREEYDDLRQRHNVNVLVLTEAEWHGSRHDLGYPAAPHKDERVSGFVIFEQHSWHFDAQNTKITVLYLAGTPDDREIICGELIQYLTKRLNSFRPYLICNIHEEDVQILEVLISKGFVARKLLRNHFGDRDAYQLLFHKNRQPALQA